jgi:hypothetical protein
MNTLLDAFYTLVHKTYPGGAEALAPRLGKAPGSLCHEVRPPKSSSAKLGLVDAVEIMELADDTTPLQLICARFGGMFVRLPQLNEAHENTMAHTARVAAEFADVLRVVSETMADGRVSANEVREIERQSGELFTAVQRMLTHMQALHEAGKPPEVERPLYAPLRAA